MPTKEHELIDGEELKALLEHSIGQCQRNLLIISAYITQVAIDWLQQHTPKGIEVHLICRLIPSDVINGSTTVSALVRGLDNGWSVSCLHSLHAKIYSIDDRTIYIGSANLTTNGLKIYGSGNLEACCEVAANEGNLRFIANIKETANLLNYDILNEMEQYTLNKEPVIYCDKWPEEILAEEEGMWVSDFFWFNPQSSQSEENEKAHDLEIIGADSLDSTSKEVCKKVLMSRCIQWLISKLKNELESELYFGKITSLLHDELKDDPTPYRKDVKSLVQNLLAYCELFLQDSIEVSQPNHSQVVHLIRN